MKPEDIVLHTPCRIEIVRPQNKKLWEVWLRESEGHSPFYHEKVSVKKLLEILRFIEVDFQ